MGQPPPPGQPPYTAPPAYAGPPPPYGSGVPGAGAWGVAPSSAYPPAYPRPAGPALVAGPPQRPAGVTIAATLAITASLQWIAGLTLAWLVALAVTDSLPSGGPEGPVFHLFNRFQARMLDGLAIPLYLFPLASLVTGFLVVARRPWTRIAHTVVGFAALGWSAWWLSSNLIWWLVPAAYVLVACLMLWTPTVSRWYGWRSDRPPHW